MRSLIEVAQHDDIGELLTAIYERCAHIEARREVHDLVKPYFEVLIRDFHDTFTFSLNYGQLHLLDGSYRSAYLLTMHRSDGLVTKWALFTNLYDEIISATEQDSDLPNTSILRH